jgi:type I restriction enzyme R subunit
MNESETRAEHIDPALKLAGWGVVSESRILREYSITDGRIEGHGKRGKALTADYVLVYRSRKLAVVEAKSLEKPLTEGVAQAKQYSEKLSIRFAYSSNGKGIYFIDMETGKEEEISSFPTPEELWKRTFAEEDKWISMESVRAFQSAHPSAQVFTYAAHHGFNCNHRGAWHAESAALAKQRTLDFFKQHLS